MPRVAGSVCITLAGASAATARSSSGCRIERGVVDLLVENTDSSALEKEPVRRAAAGAPPGRGVNRGGTARAGQAA